MSLRAIIGLLLLPLFLAPPAAGQELSRSGIKDRDLLKVSKDIDDYFQALAVDNRGAQRESLDNIEDALSKAAKKAKATEPLTAYLGDWEVLLENSKPQPREFKSNAGKGFFKFAFLEPYDGTSLGVMLSLPKTYEDGLHPVIVALKPQLGLSGADLETKVAEMGTAIYGDLLETHIVLIPLGKDEGEGRRVDSQEVPAGWFTDEGLYAFYTGFRVLLEQVRFDRSRLVLDGWGQAGQDALRIVTTSSFFSGVILRSGASDGGDVLLENLVSMPVLLIEGAEDDSRDASALKGLSGSEYAVTVVEEAGSALTPSAETSSATTEWLGRAQRALTAAEVRYKLGDIRFQAKGWCKAAVINRRVTAKPDDKDFPRFHARIDSAANTIEIDSVNVLEMEVYLSDALLDLSKPVTIKVNGEVKSTRTPRPTIRHLLDNRFYNNSQDYGLYTDMVLVEDIPANVPGRD